MNILWKSIISHAIRL